MLEFACKCTYKNGLVGIHSEITKYSLAKDLGIDKNNLNKYLKQLEEMGFIKVFNVNPFILQVLEVPQAPHFSDIKSVLLSALVEPQLYNFHRNLKRKAAFFQAFKKYDDQIKQERMKRAEVKIKTEEPDKDNPFNDSFYSQNEQSNDTQGKEPLNEQPIQKPLEHTLDELNQELGYSQ
jgi:hypothetical protein